MTGRAFDTISLRSPQWADLMKAEKGSGRQSMKMIASLAVLMTIASPLQAESLDALYAKAKAEGALSIYGGGPARLYEG